MLKPGQLDKTKRILEQINEASDVGVNDDVFFLVDDRERTNKATNFSQLTANKEITIWPRLKTFSWKSRYFPKAGRYSDAKQLSRRTRSKTIVRHKNWNDKASILISTTGWRGGCRRFSSREDLNVGVGNSQILRYFNSTYLYKKRPLAYGSVSNGQKASFLSRVKV